ncbi:uncharacterized protein LOC117881957 [Trachemys scripta elegans]|uniref:uncharacterized protein LOC117881957 n=1 Tax=Trachemys scripta elegans TaxID=31138 RepID=UPI0015552114|nr:uncharacterized protein LOC117881957 [Trachemys scripta elegans]
MSLHPPNYSKPFHLFVHERGGIASGVLTQLSGPHHFPLAFYSQQIDPVAQGTPSCTRTLAAAALLITKAKSLTLGHFTMVWTSHALSALLRRGTTQVFSAHCQQQLEAKLLEDTNLIFERCGPLNPATLLPDLPVLQDQHDCVEVVYSILQIRDNLFDVPLDNPDCILFSDGSSFYVDGKRFTGFAVTSEWDIQEAASLPGNWGAQAAELYALARACQLAAGKTVTIFTDRKYAFGVVHCHIHLWKFRGFQTAAGKPIQHLPLIHKLLDALQEPSVLAVVHCRAHTKDDSPVTRGNALADASAMMAAVLPLALPTLAIAASSFTPPHPVPVPAAELQSWESLGATLVKGTWLMPDGRACLPRSTYPVAVRWHHDKGGHYGTHALVDTIARFWYAPGIQPYCLSIVKACSTCQRNGPALPLNKIKGGRPPPAAPFQHLQIDFADMPKAFGKKHLLVLVCPLTSWVEAFPTANCTAATVAKILLRDIVPRFGIPLVLDSDRGPHFTGHVLGRLEQGLGISHSFHTPYHPQSSGKVEHMNRELKFTLAKYCQETGLKWPQVLPLVLFHLHTRPTRVLGLSPFELLYGHPPFKGGALPCADVSLLGGDHMTACQFLSLQARLRTLWKALQFSQTVPLEEQIHPFQPGDFVWAKKFVRGDTLQPRFTGPHQVLLTTQTAVFLEGRKSWIHHSHVKPAVVDHSDGPAALATTEDTASDQWTSLPLSDIRLKLTRQK